MAPASSPTAAELAVYLQPALCANHHDTIDGKVEQCTNDAGNVCGGCQLVQYCSKECQKADWKRHKTTCKSELMKESWTPEWYRSGRSPSWIGDKMDISRPKKYLWGNMPALDILNLKDNEKTAGAKRGLALLFAASGDLRNVVKTIVGLPDDHKGDCHVVVNDMEFDIVARNAIMLLVALYYDAEVAIPMIIHIWYSALLPSAMLQLLQNDILPLIDQVCTKIKHKSRTSLQTKTFVLKGRTLRIVLKKEEWSRLASYFCIPDGLTSSKAQDMRRSIALDPCRIDYRERAMLQWPPAVRQGEMYFRETGVFLPYGCSVAAFDTPNPTLFQGNEWHMKDDATPSDGWLHAEYSKHTLAAKADSFGAIFSLVRDLLMKFCLRVQQVNISFELLCVNAKDIKNHVGGRQFDRIKISNICDCAYIGVHDCLDVFSWLLKDRKANPRATLLMLFLNAAKDHSYNMSSASRQLYVKAAWKRMQEYLSLDKSPITPSAFMGMHPDVCRQTLTVEMFKDWEKLFDGFIKMAHLPDAAEVCGLRIKSKHTIVEPWPYKIGPNTTQTECQIMNASSCTGYERYIEVERIEESM